jgi:hypothetical protein
VNQQDDVETDPFPPSDVIDKTDEFAGDDTLSGWDEEEDEWENFHGPPTEKEIANEERYLRKRWQDFQTIAQFVTEAFSVVPFVEKVALFGSIARPLTQEVPRFPKFRRYRVAVPHECKDVDLAVWVHELSALRRLFKARNEALKHLREKTGLTPAHYQIDVFLLEPGTDRYLGRLCSFNSCPRNKTECRVPGCGKVPLLKQHPNFDFDWKKIEPYRVLYERKEDRAQETPF